jgi:predicted ATPase
MQEEMKHYADHLRLQGRRPLEIRVGVNMGEMVLRSIRKDDLHTEYTPIGHSTSLAARLQSLATGGGIVVSGDIQKLTEGYFTFKALGAAQIKGVSELVPLYEVLGVGPLRTRLQVALRRGLARFVGRQSEVEHLRRAFEQAKSGQGQIVGVMGEPGVGKSRLFYEFKLLSQNGCLVLETFSVSHGKAYPYLPLIDLLKNYFQITLQDDERKVQEKVAGKVLILDRALEDTLPYVFALLGVTEAMTSLQQMDPQIRKRRTFEAIKRLLVRESRNQPLLLIFEDLHWLDTETQAFLSLLSESVATARILLLVNYRPEYRHEWGSKTYYTQLRLDPLGREHAQELLSALLGDGAAFHPLKQLILEKTEGNPFFIEEIVQALREQGLVSRLEAGGGQGRTSLPPDLHLPVTVQGVLAARIDRLAVAEKELLQTLAVIGKEFSLSLLTRVVNQTEAELQGKLAHLQMAEFIYEQPAFPEVEYTFKHVLTQEVAYNSLLSERRRGLHERIAQAMEALFHARLEDHYGDLAHHYTRSGNTEKAVEYLGLAGQQAAQRSAHVEAVGHLTTALDLLKTWPETPERARQELSLQIALGPPLQLTKGFAAPEVEAAYTRAHELCHQVGETPQLLPVLWGLGRFYGARGQLQTAREVGEQLLALAQHLHDPGFLAWAHAVLAQTLFMFGEFVQERAYAEQGIALYDAQPPHAQVFHYGPNAKAVCFTWVCGALWYLGYPDQALQRSQEALAWAQGLSHPFSSVGALLTAVIVHRLRREGQAAQERAETVMTLSAEQGFVLPLAHGTLHRGWALAEQGQGEEGIAQIGQGLDACRATGAEVLRPSHLAMLAEAYGKVGQPDEGLTALAEALAIVDKTGERLYEAELYRLKGQLTLQKFQVSGSKFQVTSPQPLTPNPQAEAEAEACFLKAIEIARRQSAKSLELRAVMGLSRLWQQQGKKKEARQMLAEIYHWFTEGFDTKDLQEAQALLDALSLES